MLKLEYNLELNLKL